MNNIINYGDISENNTVNTRGFDGMWFNYDAFTTVCDKMLGVNGTTTMCRKFLVKQ